MAVTSSSYTATRVAVIDRFYSTPAVVYFDDYLLLLANIYLPKVGLGAGLECVLKLAC